MPQMIPGATTAGRLCYVLLVAIAMAAVVWVRLLPLERTETTLRFRSADGRGHVYLGDFDSYLWLRLARNRLRQGTTCDAIIAGQCRDNHAHAPVGARMLYGRSLHVTAIASLHRLITFFEPAYPLSATAFLVPVIVGGLGVLPAFGIGCRLAGPSGGLTAALLSGLQPVFLQRSIGSDNDVWNVVLPLCLMWAGIEALLATSFRRAALMAAGAGVIAVLHAAIWSGWQVTFTILFAAVLAAAARRALVATRRRRTPWDAQSTLRALLVAAVFFATTLAGVAIGARSGFAADTLSSLPHMLLETVGIVAEQPHESPVQSDCWPNSFSSVGELARPALPGVRYSVGDFLLGAGWFGALLLMFPPRDWRWWHAGLFVFCIGLSGYAFTRVGFERTTLLGLLAIPIGVAWMLGVFNWREETATDVGVLLAVWQLAVLMLAHEALRFTMILVPPLALGAAVVVGRSYERMNQWLVRLPMRRRTFARAALTAAFGIACIAPVRRGGAFARSYTPAMDSAWWDTLTAIRDSTTPDTIVNTFWNYGYWAEYVADRRVSADGASLGTHLPYWLARVFYAGDEREAVGLLRMLDCGSDATPLEEGAQGAYGKLVARGVDEVYAPTLITELAKRDRAAAQALLKARSFSDDAIADVLASTHCAPPPAVLLLTSQLGRMPAWSYIASWNFAEVETRKHLRFLPEPEQLDALTRRFELSPDEARRLLERTRLIRRPGYLPQVMETEHWIDCTPQADGRGFLCPIGKKLERFGVVLLSITVRTDDPTTSRMQLQNRVAETVHVLDVRPAMVLIAGEGGIDTTPLSAPWSDDLAILFDAVHHRVLAGSPAILQSTFTKLMYLDGRYSTHFRKLQDHIGFDENHVAAWSVDWHEGS